MIGHPGPPPLYLEPSDGFALSRFTFRRPLTHTSRRFAALAVSAQGLPTHFEAR